MFSRLRPQETSVAEAKFASSANVSSFERQGNISGKQCFRNNVSSLAGALNDRTVDRGTSGTDGTRRTNSKTPFFSKTTLDYCFFEVLHSSLFVLFVVIYHNWLIVEADNPRKRGGLDLVT